MTGQLRGVLLALLVLTAGITAGAAPAAAEGAGSATLTPALAAQTGFLGTTMDPGDDLPRYGVDGHLGYVISFEAGHLGAIETWANASSEREIKTVDNDSNWLVVAAPAEAVGVLWRHRLFGSTLAEQSYVELPIGVVTETGVDPIDASEIANESAWEPPSSAWVARFSGGKFTSEGVAFGGEVNTTPLNETRDRLGVDAVAVDGTGVRVGIIATGLNYRNETFGERVVAGKNTITNATINASADNYTAIADGNLHGSYVATQIAGNGSAPTAQGVAPAAELVIVKALGDDGSGRTADVAEGLDYVCEQNVDVVSMSLGAPLGSKAIQAEISECLTVEDVAAIVVAAGNSRLTYRYLASPADHERTIAVGATDARAINASESAYFSNVGPDPRTGATMTIGAPGMKITTQLENTNGVLVNKTWSGTSMAAPLVAGVAALVLDKHGDMAPTELRERLTETANRLPEAGVTEVGAGRVNASRAVNNTVTNTTQAKTRNATAEGRDKGNKALAGSFFRPKAAASREGAA